jgi:hypothetical protein
MKTNTQPLLLLRGISGKMEVRRNTMHLSEQQTSALRNGEAVRVWERDLECVVMRGDLYDRIKQLLYDDSEWTDHELRQMLAKSAEMNGWNEPEMNAYDNYDEAIAKQYR